VNGTGDCFQIFTAALGRPTDYLGTKIGVVQSLCIYYCILYLGCGWSGVDPGAGGPGPPYFWQSQFYFLHCIQCLNKIVLKLNFDFIVAEIRGVFLEVWGVYTCVCLCDPIGLHDKSVVFLSNIGGFRNCGRYCFLFCKGPILNEAILIPRIYARLQQIASNFSKFSWEASRRRSRFLARFGASPSYRASSFQNSWIRPGW